MKMDRRGLQSAVLFATLLGAILLLPPLVLLPANRDRLLGLPHQVIYLFAVWLSLVMVAFWFGRTLPRDGTGQGKDQP